MFNHSLFLKGLVIGFSIAMPVGPIGLLCIRNVLAGGALSGIITGLGAAAADAFYGLLAGFGITALSEFVKSYSLYFQTLGALFLCYLGIKTFLAKAAQSHAQENAKTHSGLFFTTFFLTLTNPLTIVSFAAIFASLGIGSESNDVQDALATTLGVFLGSLSWWFVLSFTSLLVKGRIQPLWLNRISGSVILGFGVQALFF